MDPRPIISAILEKDINGERRIFLQERWKPKASPTYSGMWEIPAGGIDSYENVYDALRREVKEECGLDIVEIVDDVQGPVEAPRPGDRAFVFRPYLCQEVLETNNGLPWIGFVFRCRVEGEVTMDPEEARNPRWVTMPELRELLDTSPEKFFPLQLPVLKHYCADTGGLLAVSSSSANDPKG